MKKSKILAAILSVTLLSKLFLPTISVYANELETNNMIKSEREEEKDIIDSDEHSIIKKIDDSESNEIINGEVQDKENNLELDSSTVDTKSIVQIPDLNLKTALNEKLGQVADAEITNDQLQSLTSLDISNRNISNLDGLENCINLKSLNARNNNISDVLIVGSLTNLTSLLLDDNQIANISAFSNLDKLTKLTLNNNNINDISVLLDMDNIKDVYIINNSIEKLPNLNKEFNTLNLSQNKIRDISPLSGITITKNIILSNQIVAGGNFVADDSTFSIDNIIKNIDGNPIAPQLNSGYDYDNVNNKISLKNIYVSGGRKYNFNETINVSGKSIIFNGTVRVEIERIGKAINIQDENLRAALNEALGKEAMAEITNLELQTMEKLNISNKGISDLSGLENCHKLVELIASENSFTSLEPIKSLINLKVLNIDRNDKSIPIENLDIISNLINLNTLSIVKTGATDISFLNGLNKLVKLTLRDNNITNLTPLTNKDTLTHLYLQRNDFTDINTLGTLDNLQQLFLSENNLNDISALANLKKLTRLHMNNTNIDEVESLSELTNLTELLVGDNNIVNMDSLANLTNIERLSIFSNPIKDGNISFVSGLTKMKELYAHHNNISDISPLANLKLLTHISLDNNRISDLTPLAGLNIKTGYLENQKVTLDSIKSVNNIAIANNIIVKDKDGNSLELKNITNSGIYDKENNSIIWENIIEDSTENIRFSQLLPFGNDSSIALYSGIIEQPIKYTETPIIFGVDDVNIKMGSKFDSLDGVVAKDKEDGDLTDSIKVDGTVDINIPGEYKLIYTVTDSDGNTTDIIRKVLVQQKLVDMNTAPTIIGENKTLKVGDSFDPMSDISATDLEDGNLTDKITILENTVDTSKTGTYKVIYQVIDSAGALTTKTIKIVVVKKEGEIITTEIEKPTISSNETVKPTDKLPNTGSESNLPTIGGLAMILGSALLFRRKK